MHEIIDYSKNFVTGITNTVTKKKEDAPYIGVATIQLFGKNKELIQEVKSTNCITNAMLSKMYNDMFKLALLKNIRGKINDPLGSTYSPAYWMLLTNNTEPENINEKNFKGNLVGFANGWTPYVGSSALQGTVNLSETTGGDWNKHFVIDFPTNAGNGTFKSIYWSPNIGESYGTQVVATDLITSGLTSRPEANLCCNSTFAFSSYADSDFNKINKINLSTKENSILNLDKSVRSICCNETNLFVLGEDKIVYKYTLEGVLVNSLFSIVTSYSSGCRMTYFNEEIIIHDKDTKTISFYNLTGTKIRSYNTGLDKVSNIYLNKENEIALVVDTASMNLHILKTLTGDISFKRRYIVFSDTQHTDAYGSGEAYGICKTGNNIYVNFKGTFLKCTDCDYFSHTLLPEPITKTSANTMKIQYDFIIEPRGYFDV